MQYLAYYDSPVGQLGVVTDGTSVTYIRFACETVPEATQLKETPLHREVIYQLNEYFAGTRREFALPLNARGTDFQQQVWRALGEIPYGTTCSYGQLAEKIGKPRACRAVGLANGKNPLPIVVPCHRVIGADGSLTGFGGGLEIKRQLLAVEGVALV